MQALTSALSGILKNKVVLITGAGGFIGSNLTRYLSENFKDTLILALESFSNMSEFSNGNPTRLGHFKNLQLRDNIKLIAKSINNNLIKIFKNYKIDYILHNAAISDTTCQDMSFIMKNNYDSFLNILELAKRKNASIIYASSAAVYGNTKIPNTIGINEIPENIYGFSKLAMDNELRRLKNIKLKEAVFKDKKATNEISIISLRYFNVYGDFEFYKHKSASMILQLSLQALKYNEVKLFKSGEQRRDFVHIDDVVKANMLAIKLCFEGHIKDIFNVGSGIATSYNEIITYLKDILGDFKVTYIDNPYKFFQNNTKSNDLDFLPEYKPSITLEEGIKKYVNNIKDIYYNKLQK